MLNKQMKKITAIIVVLAMLICLTPSAFADGGERYYTQSITWFSSGNSDNTQLMVKDSHIYIEVSHLAEKMGYGVNVSGKGAMMTNVSPFRIISFKTNSQDVCYISGSMECEPLTLNYNMPCTTVKNEKGFWVPFVYTLRLLDSGYLSSSSFVTKPAPTLLSDFSDMTSRHDKYKFDALKDLDSKKSNYYLSGVTTMLNGFLNLDPAAFSQKGMDKKYTEQIAVLFCTQSQDEIRMAAEEMELAYNTLTMSGELSDVTEGILSYYDEKNLNALMDDISAISNKLKYQSESSAEINQMVKTLEKAGRDKEVTGKTLSFFSKLKEKYELSKSKKVAFNVLLYAINAMSYYEEMKEQDQNALSAMQDFSSFMERTQPQYISYDSASSIDSYLKDSDSTQNMLKHSACKAFEVDTVINLSDSLSGGNLKRALFGASGSAILFGWNIVSNYVPVLHRELEISDRYTLATYCQPMQKEAERWYYSSLNNLYSHTKDQSAWDEYAKSSYTFLKMSYISRENGISILTLAKDRVNSKERKTLDEYISILKQINAEIAEKASLYYKLIGDYSINDDAAYLGMIPPVENELQKHYASIEKLIIDTFTRDDTDSSATKSSKTFASTTQSTTSSAFTTRVYDFETSSNDGAFGNLSGKICRASDRVTPISGAVVHIYKDDSLYKKCTADSNGCYSVSLPKGSYLVTITSSGYLDFSAFASSEEGKTTYMETFLMIQGTPGMSGTAAGTIINSITGTGEESVTLRFYKKWNNTFGSDYTGVSTSTDMAGNYAINLPLGNYTVAASKNGFLTSYFNIIVQDSMTDNQNGIITPSQTDDTVVNNYLITLTWGEDPRDLDAHLIGELSSGEPFHVYFRHKTQTDDNQIMCSLDYDDQYSYGPEHITLKAVSNQPYYFYVHRYEGYGSIATSGAKVTVHKGNNLISEYNVPTSLGEGDYWNVFAIFNGRLVVRNTVTDSAEVNYL